MTGVNLRHTVLCALLSVALPLTVVRCSKTDSAPPVATVSFSASKTSVTLGSPVDLTYRFTVSPTAKFSGDYHVFLHVISDDGQKVWDDDHDPATPTSQSAATAPAA